jgi:hypothetical protein
MLRSARCPPWLAGFPTSHLRQMRVRLPKAKLKLMCPLSSTLHCRYLAIVVFYRGLAVINAPLLLPGVGDRWVLHRLRLATLSSWLVVPCCPNWIHRRSTLRIHLSSGLETSYSIVALGSKTRYMALNSVMMFACSARHRFAPSRHLMRTEEEAC